MCSSKSKKIISLISIILFSVILFSCASKNSADGKINGSYAASEKAFEIALNGGEGFSIKKNSSGDYILTPDKMDDSTGFVFYPGGKVQMEAYLPLLSKIAEKGSLVILVHMPQDLAIFNKKGAEKYLKLYPEIQHWYLGGHSLGGAMAGDYISKKSDFYEGLVFLAAYSQKKIDDKLKVLSILGTEDQVLNMQSYEKYKGNLPSGFTELVISGGCHSFFGDYGNQKGDGIPQITRQEQFSIVAEAINNFIR